MAECIHGLDAGLCNICYPKAPPEPSRASSTARRPSVTRPPTTRTSTRAPRTSSPSRSAHGPRINVGDQRIYHVTHIRNLPAILDVGGLLADVRPVLDLSSELTRELRRTAEVADGVSVADHVPFFLAPNATLWEDVRTGAIDETRWSPAARAAAPFDFVVLVSTMNAVGDGAVMTDGDAAATFTRFATTTEASERMLRRLRDDDEAMLAAEVLVKDTVPFGAVTLIGVANDPVRERVREILDGTEFSPKVAVYPPWFASD